MKIRYTINHDMYEVEIDRTLQIVADDGRDMYHLTCEDAELSVKSGRGCKHGGELYDNQLSIKPRFANEVIIKRERYE